MREPGGPVGVSQSQETSEEIQTPDTDRGQSSVGLTLRAILLGLLLIAAIVIIHPYTAFRGMISSRQAWIAGDGGLLQGPLQVAFLLLVANTLLMRFLPRSAFSRNEILVVYSMLVVALATVYGSQTALVSFIPYPYNTATPYNDWAHLIMPYIPSWFVPKNALAARWFWEGLPKGVGVPWGAWSKPLLMEAAFFMTLMTAMYCLGSLVSRDWMERQRLVFPIAEIPLAVVGGDGSPSLRSGIWTNRVFWIGLAIPTILNLSVWLNERFPSVPCLDIMFFSRLPETYFRGMPLPWSVLGDMRAKLDWRIIGIACLVPGEVSLSLWLFHILFRVQMLIWASYGIVSGGSAPGGFDPHTFTGFMEAGGFLVLGATVLYQSRRAISFALRAIFRRPQHPEIDPYLPLSGRWALIGFFIANAVLLWWLAMAGGSWSYFAGMLVLVYIYALGAARLIAAGGVVFVTPHIFLRGLAIKVLGGAAIGARSLAVDTYVGPMFLDDSYMMNLPMSHMINSFRILRTSRTPAKMFALAAATGVAVMLGVGLPALLWWAYRGGATGMDRWYFHDQPQLVFGQLDAQLRGFTPPDSVLRVAMVLGAIVMLSLTYLHMNFLWWPVSPIGFVIASSEMTNRTVWANFLIGWFVSTTIRRIGGLRLYRAARPVFIGLVLGDLMSALLLLLIR